MKIAIVNLTSGGLSGGYRKYLQKILPLLQMNQNTDFIFLYLHYKVVGLIEKSIKIDVVPVKDSRSGKKKIIQHFRNNSVDVVFIPTTRWLDCGSIPTVIMVRNMEPLISPFKGNPLQESFKNLVRYYVAKRSCIRATKIIAVSEFVKDHIIKKWNLDPQKVEVIYHGIEVPRVSLSEEFPVEIPEGWINDFLFTAGSIRPARGLEDIIHALMELKKRGISKRVIIAGGIDPSAQSYKRKIDTFAERNGIQDQVFWAGHLSAGKMSWCYKKCSAFIMTSRVEACPNIVLEAMAHGCVCISTTTMPMPEFFKDSALYYSPDNPATLSDRIMDVHTMDKDKENKMRSMALARSINFTWERCANKTIALLNSTVKSTY